MPINGYSYSSLDKSQLDKIVKIEKELNKANNDEVVLLAFNKE